MALALLSSLLHVVRNTVFLSQTYRGAHQLGRDPHASRHGAGSGKHEAKWKGSGSGVPWRVWVRADDGSRARRQGGPHSLTPHPLASPLPLCVPSPSGLPSRPSSFLPSRPHQTKASHTRFGRPAGAPLFRSSSEPSLLAFPGPRKQGKGRRKGPMF